MRAKGDTFLENLLIFKKVSPFASCFDYSWHLAIEIQITS